MSARLIKRDHQNGVETLVLGGAGESVVASSPFEVMKPAPARSNEDEANRIVEQALEKAAAIEKEARENARQFLATELTAEIAKTIDPWRDRLAQSLDELDGLRAEITADAERELVRLALEIARKVVHREVTIDHEIVMTLARLGLSRAHTRVNATIHLHYDDLEYVNSNRRRLNATQALELVQDRSVSRGGCLIHTEMGDVDARIEQQFEEIERAFLG
jgi:flagellar assembly protein FliH